MKNSYVFFINAIISTFQLFFLIGLTVFVIIFVIAPFTIYKEAHWWDFTIHIDGWFYKNWIKNHYSSLSELLKYNWWIILYETFLILIIWLIIFFFLFQLIIFLNYLKIKESLNFAESREFIFNNFWIFYKKSLNKNFNSNLSDNEIKTEWNKFDEKFNRTILFASIFPFFYFIFWIKLNNSLKFKNEIKKTLFSPSLKKSINHRLFFQVITFRKKIDRIFWLTFLSYLLMLSAFCSIIMMWVSYGFSFSEFSNKLNWLNKHGNLDKDEAIIYEDFVKLSPFASTLTYFTQFSNISCFLCILVTMIKPKSNIFKNNTLLIFVATYISVVAIIYWVVLFPNDFDVNNKDKERYTPKLLGIDFFNTLFLHAFTPFMFVTYTLSYISINKMKHLKFSHAYWKMLIYPVFYTIFLYALPFFTKISVYGPLSNLNKYNSIHFEFATDVSWIVPEFSKKTNNLYPGVPVLGWLIILFIAFFVFIYSLFYGYNKFIYWRFSNKTKIKQQHNGKEFIN
ncbi:MAG: hypothetical protein ACRDCG_02055 [Mycoplasmoidaceae bacterium]